MSVQLTTEQESELAHLAQASDRTTDELAQEAVARFLHAQEEHRAAVERSRAQAAAGHTHSHEEVFSNLKKRMGW
jgi:predicted transcriptional regulator